MKRICSNQSGTTMVELLVYLGISSVVVTTMMSYLASFTKVRVAAVNQQAAQYNARITIERMSYFVRNSYRIETRQLNGKPQVVLYGRDPDHPSQDSVSIFEFGNGTIAFAQMVGAEPDPSDLKPFLDSDVSVESADFSVVSSALRFTW